MINITQGERGYSTTSVEALTSDMRKEGWRECITSTPPDPIPTQENLGFYKPVYTYNEDDDTFSQEWEWVQDDSMILAEIERLKAQLSETDYIIIKTYEARLMGLDDPYDSEYLEQITTNRERTREEIREMLHLLQMDLQ